MKYQVGDKLQEMTTRCEKGFSCLDGDPSCLCAVTDCVMGDVVFVEFKKDYCRYSVSYGNERICTCPIRKALYNQYRV
jgi:hypothetical protein